jgi:hypothetical protein
MDELKFELPRRGLRKAALGGYFMFILSCLWPVDAEELALAAPTNALARARVVAVEHPQATRVFTPRPDIVATMIHAGVLKLTGITNVSQAWRSWIGIDDVVGVKVYSEPGSISGTRPAVVAAVVRDLREAGLPGSQIIIWDRQMAHLEAAGFKELAQQLGVQIAASNSAGYETNRFYENQILGQLVWGDLEFGHKEPAAARKSHLTSLLTQRITKIINIAPLLNHNQVGISGLLYGLASASVDNYLRFEGDGDRMAMAIPEIIAMPEVGDRVVLNIMDALIAQYQGGQRGLLHYSIPLNQIWFCRDPVALDILGIRELQSQRQAADISRNKVSLELYENAALLEIGIADERRIVVDTLHLASSTKRSR